MKCPNCGAETPEDKNKCLYCDCELPKPESEKQKNVQNIKNITQNITYNINYENKYSNSKNQAPVSVPKGKKKNKWIAFFLCLFTFCGHKFYEGNKKMGLIYLFTLGLFGIGWLIDIFLILKKPNPYYV